MIYNTNDTHHTQNAHQQVKDLLRVNPSIKYLINQFSINPTTAQRLKKQMEYDGYSDPFESDKNGFANEAVLIWDRWQANR